MFINQIKATPATIYLSTTIHSLKKTKNGFNVILSNKKVITCYAIVIACGIGAFKPIELERAIDKNINIKYVVDDINSFKNKRVVVLGGGDSAVD
jgi:thioredoxin reductase (NADPH)